VSDGTSSVVPISFTEILIRPLLPPNDAVLQKVNEKYAFMTCSETESYFLCRELEEVMKQIGWPFISDPGPDTLSSSPTMSEKSVPSPYNPPEPSVQFDKVIGCLLVIDLPYPLC